MSGSNEWEAGSGMYQDRLYLNDGNGIFSRNVKALPEMLTSGSCVRPGDLDGDGDMDLFVGGRIVPGKYPLPARSYLLKNEGGTFVDVTDQVSKDLLSPGLVSDAVWTDYDNDGDEDLMVVGEWMPITLFENNQGQLQHANIASFQNTSGWWYSLAVADMDQDGDMDYLAGNVGLNYKYKASSSEPFQVFADDFDENGSLDIVLGYFNQGQLFPLRGKQCSSEQMPFLKKKYPEYSSFASATLEEIYGADKLSGALHYKAHMFASVYIENQGNGQFQIRNLPVQAQFSAVNDFLLDDLDQDGNKDVLLAGNMYHSEVETARNDAGTGLLLTGDGKGNFQAVSPQRSGFFTAGDVKSLTRLSRADSHLVLVGNNAGRLQVFTGKK